MTEQQTNQNPTLNKMVGGLKRSVGERLESIILYGSAARGDYEKKTSDFNLLLVLRDLEVSSLEALSPVLRRWLRQGQPVPRLFTRELIRDAADVFPIEFLDILAGRVVLHGDDPFADLEVHPTHLRLQCERELREKIMRLREGYAESHDNSRNLKRLLTSSYTTFVALFRGCLHLLGGEVPVHNPEVVAAFCNRADIRRDPFEEVDRLKHGESVPNLKATFGRYYAALSQAVRVVDRFENPK
ncbi:MAG: nucleotidyltransferase domain-containing protein [Acidobacteria bacterium]|nr:nucleotidyltransferase domain-containing protein [Acidobacteriota bacterium]